MSDLSVAWLLHSRPYKERSVIADFLVQDIGRVAMVVQGVRQTKSKIAPLVQPFNRVLVSWRGRSELKTLTSVELSRSFHLAGSSLYCGLYVNELLLRAFLPGQSQDGLLDMYEATIGQLSVNEQPQPALRWFELSLLELTGYLPDLCSETVSGQSIQPDCYYRLLPEQGLSLLAPDMPIKNDCFYGAVLLAMSVRDFSCADWQPAFKRFSRMLLPSLIGDKPLQSRSLFMKTVQDSALKIRSNA